MRRLPDIGNVTQCPNCGKEAIQSIELNPGEVVVTCMNCGAARHYTLDGMKLEMRFDEPASDG
jgi:uncharacterized Zn finger protein